MAYYTDYSLFVHNATIEQGKAIEARLSKLGLIGRGHAMIHCYPAPPYFDEPGVIFDNEMYEKWDDHEHDMLELSKEFPDLHFELHGEGDSNDDIWDKHFLNGKMQTCMAEIIIPPFDPEKLE